MKKSSLIITILLALSIAVLYVLHFTGLGTGKSIADKSDTQGSEAPSGSIVYIRIDSLLNAYDFSLNSRLTLPKKPALLKRILTRKDVLLRTM